MDMYSKAGEVVQEVFSSLRTVLSLNGEKLEEKRYKSKLQATRRSSICKGAMFGFLVGWIYLIGYLIYSVGFAFGSSLMNHEGHERLSFSDLLVILITSTRLITNIAFVSPFFQLLEEARGALVPVSRLIDEEEKTSMNETQILQDSVACDETINMNGDIQFDNINFAYPARPDVLVLRNLTLTARPGEITALVGSNGSGKSTCFSLLLRFYEPLSGGITINDRSITDYNLKQLRQKIGVVSQEPILFATSIYENIRFGKENATRIEIEEAARQANAHDFIMKLPNKYDTVVGERGVLLSGGEKQRVCLARALVKQPAVLLLDEATSALDKASEEVVQEALDRACKGRTTIVIAHRFATIQNAHRIYMLHNGCVIEQGTHEILISKEESQYWKIMKAQQREQLENDIEVAASLTQYEDADQKQTCTSTCGPYRYVEVICCSFKTVTKSIYKGASGCGKSTVIQLLERFYDPMQGRISLDGVDIRELNIQWLRSCLGLVSQEPILFDLTIAENIAYGIENTSIEDIIDAAIKANIHDFIQQLPQGYETKVGMKGSHLSGGEKQRIALARVLLRRPTILLLDEATSAMDSYNEQIVQETLEKAQTDDPTRTSLIITHRLSTIRSCDLICFLDKGHIVESGTHAALIERRGAYYHMIVRSCNL
ncbi:unnamed protein product [Rotaria sp. Silwood1]|nr:unnamed protein product [Rotaria sp. Silwood1]